MDILVIGDETSLIEVKEKFGENHVYHSAIDQKTARAFLKSGVIVFDFVSEDVSIYKGERDLVVFINSVFTTLTSMVSHGESRSLFFGFCGLRSFFDREILELTTLDSRHVTNLELVCSKLNTKYQIVEDRVGMVTPRIICMIINEAFFAVEDNIASKKDIDLAMRLGTNYPLGPFEWADKIGLRHVARLLKSVHSSSGDERYKACKLIEN